MSNKKIIRQTEIFVKESLKNESTCHDWWHVDRVRNIALYIAKHEEKSTDLFIIELAALLHDIADWKFNDGDEEVGSIIACKWLLSFNEIPKFTIDSIYTIIKNIAFRGANVNFSKLTLEEKIVQDADRLDAMGAIGIARTFAFGGARKREIYNPDIKPSFHNSFQEYKANQSTTINHFYEKLLLLKDKMNTATGRFLAEDRHQFLEEFVKKFLEEWNYST